MPKITSLTNKDFEILNVAIDICESDYDSPDCDGSLQPYQVKMLKDLEQVRKKLRDLQEQQNYLLKSDKNNRDRIRRNKINEAARRRYEDKKGKIK